MADLHVNSIGDASGGNTTTINGYTPTVSNMAGRNRIINGDFRVAQRGTSGTTTSAGYVSLDRWRAYISTSSTVTLSQQVFTPGQTDVSGDPEFFMRYDWLGTGSPSTKIIMQRIENVKSLVGTVTLSFYAKTELGDNIDVEIYQNFGSGGSTEVTAYDQTVDVTDAWVKYTITFDLPSLSGKTIGASSYIEVSFASRNTTANSYLDIAQVQLEAGSVATPFEHRPYGQELALCMRYFEKSYHQSVVPGSNASLGMRAVYSSVGSASYRFFGDLNYVVPKRTNGVAITFYSETGTAGKISKYNANTTTQSVSSIGGGYGETVIGSYIQTSSGDSSEPYLFHFTADSEL